MVIGTLLSITTQISELLVGGVFGAGKTMCIALLASWFALRGHCVYYVSRENTTIKAMAEFVHQLLPRGPDDKKPIALRLSAGSQARSGPGTSLDARDRDDNHTVFNAKLILATTGLHLAQFRHRHRPLEKAVDYAELLIHDEAQQEASMSDVTILGALPRKCLVLRLGDPKQTSGGTAPSPLARQVREVSDQLPLGIRAPRTPWLQQHIPRLIAQLLIDPIPPPLFAATDLHERDPEGTPPLSANRLAAAGLATPPEDERNASPGISIDNSQSPTTVVLSTASAMPPGSDQSPRSNAPEDALDAPVSYAREQLWHCLCHVLFAPDLRWVTVLDIDACAGVTPPHDWAIMFPVSCRVQPDVYTVMAISRYRDALLNLKPRAAPRVYPALPVDINTNAYDILLCLLGLFALTSHNLKMLTMLLRFFSIRGISSLRLSPVTAGLGLSFSRLDWMLKISLLECLLTLATATLLTLVSLRNYNRLRYHPARSLQPMLRL